MTTLRHARESDGAAMWAIYAPYVERTATSFELEAPSIEEMAARVARHSDTHPWLVAEEGGELLGYAYASPHRARAAYQWCVEVSAYVAAVARRRGVARRLYTALFRQLEAQGYVNAYAGIRVPNDESVGFHEALGFVRVALYPRVGWKLGAWHDVAWYARDLRPGHAPPGPLLRTSEVDVALD